MLQRYFHVDVSPIDDEPVHFHEHLPQETSRHQPPQPSRQNGTNSIPEVDHMNRRAPTLVIPRTREPKPNHDQRRDHQTSSDQSPALQTEAKPRQPAAGDAPDTAPSVLDSVTRMLATPSGRGKSPASTFGQRMRALGRSKPDPVDSRPPWYGPSGRAKLLQPIRDDDGATTLTMPRKNVNGTVRGAAASNCPPDAQLETSNAAAAAGAATDTANSLQPLAQNGRASNKPATPSSSLSSTTSSTSPSSLLHRGRQQLQRSHLEAESPPSTSSDSKSSDSKSLTSSSAFTPREVIKRKPPPFPSTTASISAQARHASDPTIAGRSTTKDDRVEIASRFGVTTFATSNPATLRQERDRTPVPTPPLQSTSVMNRRRPVGGGHGGKSAAEPVLISMRNTSAPETESNPHRRPSDPTEHTHLTGSGQLVDRRSSASPAAKPLPLAPHELQSSKDPVETLKAEVDVLAHRRMNINKCIQQMTARMPSDNLMASQQLLRKRENEKIAALKEELAEVQKDEYTVGLKLHRAYKRMERNSNYEQTGLWVSRVAR
ncbi:hypothetical protein RJ55_02525 [Drechmeria coniospora]|nr:hypothetical protein RJ55_02525 [Drechmeria coniospora]